MLKLKYSSAGLKDILYICTFAVLLSMALLPYYVKGTLILSGEGDYVLDFANHIKNFGFMWFPTYSTGMQNILACGTGLNIILLCIIEKITQNPQVVNFTLIFSLYFFPFLSMYLLSRQMRAKHLIAFLIGFFYVINPFMYYYLTSINQWNVFSVVAMPLFFWAVLKFFGDNFRLFFYFGLVSLCVSFGYTNPPMLVVIFSVIPLFILFSYFFLNEKFNLFSLAKKYILILFSFVLFNFWWILCFLRGGAINTAQSFYTPSFAEAWLNSTVRGHGAILIKMMSLTTIIGSDTAYDFPTMLYNTFFGRLIVLIPILIIVYHVLMSQNRKTGNGFNLGIFLVFLTASFLAKGSGGPFGFIYLLMFKFVPFFYIYKSPVEKFGILFLFVFTILLLRVLSSLVGQKYYRLTIGLFGAYLLFCSLPVFSGNILPEYRIGDNGTVSRRYKEKISYKQARENINHNPVLFRVLSLPTIGNYQLCLPNYNGKKYVGLDPLLLNTNKSFIAAHHKIDILFKNISLPGYGNLLKLYNIGKIIVNEESVPWFGSTEPESVLEMEVVFDKAMPQRRWGPIRIYDNKNNFLPLIYSAGSTS